HHVGDGMELRGRQADVEVGAQRPRKVRGKELTQALAGDAPDHFADQVAVGQGKPETGTQLVLTPAAATWYPRTHATCGAESTRRPSLPRPEPVRGEDAPVRPGRRLRAFQRVMIEAHRRHPIRILSYCILANHWHFVVWPQTDCEVTDFFRWLAHTHAMRWRVAHRTVGYGPLYQGRFKSFPVQSDEHVLTVLRYVERNALGAGLVERAEHWRWGGLWARVHGDEAVQALLSPWPVERP